MDDPAGTPESKAALLTEQIIERFGGIRPMAAKLDTPVTTVQGWKKRGVIPVSRHGDILVVANREGIALDPAELAQTDPGGGTGTRGELRAPDSGGDRSWEPPAERVRPAGASRPSRAAMAVALLALIATVAISAVGWQFVVNPMQKRVAALETRVASVEPGSNVVRRLDVLESELAQRPQPGSAGAPSANGPAASASGTGGDVADRVAALEQQVAQLKTLSPDSDQLAKRLSELQLAAGGRELLAQSIRDIQSSTAATQGEVERVNEQLKAVGQRLDQVDAVLSQRRQQALREEAVVLAVGQLRAALRDSKPFRNEIASVRALTSDDHDIGALLDQLQPMADTGISTMDDLRTDFSRIAPEIVRNAVVGDGSSWWRQALYRIESVISIRRVGEGVPGDKTDAIVARAEAKLEQDDLDGAITTLGALSGLAAEGAASWIHDAQQRLTADRAEAELTRLAIGRVATGTGSGAQPEPRQPPDPAQQGPSPQQSPSQ